MYRVGSVTLIVFTSARQLCSAKLWQFSGDQFKFPDLLQQLTVHTVTALQSCVIWRFSALIVFYDCVFFSVVCNRVLERAESAFSATRRLSISGGNSNGFVILCSSVQQVQVNRPLIIAAYHSYIDGQVIDCAKCALKRFKANSFNDYVIKRRIESSTSVKASAPRHATAWRRIRAVSTCNAPSDLRGGKASGSS